MIKFKLLLLLVRTTVAAVTFAALCAHASIENNPSEEDQRLEEFFEAVFQQHLSRHPVMQSHLGFKDDYGKWDDLSSKFSQQSLILAKANLAFLYENFDYDKLSKQAQVSYRLFETMIKNDIKGLGSRSHYYTIDEMLVMYREIPAFMINIHKIENIDDALDYIERLYGLEIYINQIVELLKIHNEKKPVVAHVIPEQTLEEIDNIISGIPFDKSHTDSPLMADFRKKVTALHLPESQSHQLLQKAKDALINSVKPAYMHLYFFIQEKQSNITYSPIALSELGLIYPLL